MKFQMAVGPPDQDGRLRIVEGDPDCEADPCSKHGVCHCRCVCMGDIDDCPDCAALKNFPESVDSPP